MSDLVPVRCAKGHVYGSVWVPFVSFKAIRLGRQRWQRCPVCQRFRMTTRVSRSELTPALEAEARARPDSGWL